MNREEYLSFMVRRVAELIRAWNDCEDFDKLDGHVDAMLQWLDVYDNPTAAEGTGYFPEGSSGIEAAGRVPQGSVAEDAKNSEPAHVAAPIEGRHAPWCGKKLSELKWWAKPVEAGKFLALCHAPDPPRALPTEPAKPACEICNDTGTDNGDGYARPCPNACNGAPTKQKGPTP